MTADALAAALLREAARMERAGTRGTWIAERAAFLAACEGEAYCVGWLDGLFYTGIHTRESGISFDAFTAIMRVAGTAPGRKP